MYVGLKSSTNRRILVFQLLLKYYEAARPPLGRPIGSSYESPTKWISAFVGSYLSFLVINLPSHI